MKNKSYIIFALARTGSTALMELLNTRKDLQCIHEPFNPDNKEFSYHGQILNEEDLFNCIRMIYENVVGFKHVWHHNGWPFEHIPDLNKLLLTRTEKIIFLNRKNILRRIVSSQLSQQAQVWHFLNSSDRRTFMNFNYRPLNLELIRWHIINERRCLLEYKKFMKDQNIEFLEVWYEDFFDENLALEERKMNFLNVCSFLQSKPDVNTMMHKIDALLSASNRINTPRSYRKVPNIYFIEDEFGSDETGWLLK